MSTPIRIGDKFRSGDRILEVIGTKPGGKVELFDRERVQFIDRWHKDIKTWERM